MRLLHRKQFAAYLPGTERHPQGRLFDDLAYSRYQTDPDVKEAIRRRAAGENNPAAPWRTPMLQHHFLTHPEPIQGRF